MSHSLWQPQQPDQTQIAEFFSSIPGTDDYAAMHAYSINHAEEFWRRVWTEYDLIGEGSLDEVLRIEDADRPMLAHRWFPRLKLNYAENLLKERSEGSAIRFYGEDGSARTYRFGELRKRVLTVAAYLRSLGVEEGDRVAGFVPNHAETVVLMLATTALGGVWTSCSPDFGDHGVVDRFGQTEPKVLVMADGYFYNGKAYDCIAKAKTFLPRLTSVRNVIVFTYAGSDCSLDELAGDRIRVHAMDTVAAHPESLPDFVRVSFDAPLFILYSSGTTGAPKCIVHSVGGALIQHVKEHRLHTDIKEGDTLFYFTTCGWMMWNWLVSGLASGATIVLFDGSPFYPTPNRTFDLIDDARISHFGTSAKFIDACAKEGLVPQKSHKLDNLRCILSTGSPLVAKSYRYIYEAIKSDVHLASISGGTDIVSCFVLGVPILPVYAGEIQAPGLGLAVKVLNDAGDEMPIGEKGELCCVAPFPAMPIGFYNDTDGNRFRSAYFDKVDGVWCHGDFMVATEHGGYVILGRSDAVLNPGGVRIGTAEIYQQVEQVDEVLESIVIGQAIDDDVRVVLFVRLRDGVELNQKLQDRIKKRIRDNTTPRHMPAVIVKVNDIPRTRSGKIVELAVRDIVNGKPINNLEALANPEALDQFKDRPELQK